MWLRWCALLVTTGLAQLHVELHYGGFHVEFVICFWGALAVGAHSCSPPVFSQQSQSTPLKPLTRKRVFGNISCPVTSNGSRSSMITSIFYIHLSLAISPTLLRQSYTASERSKLWTTPMTPSHFYKQPTRSPSSFRRTRVYMLLCGA